MIRFILISTNEQYAAAAKLFEEYSKWLGIDLCFQGFLEELNDLRQMYGLPHGGIILCEINNEFVGCVAVRRIDDSRAELKRMYLQPQQQQKGIGSALLDHALLLARECGYKKIQLDTLSTMKPAMNLYLKNGFVEIPPYYHNPIETAVYFEKLL
jgi:putative acetyltransferase